MKSFDIAVIGAGPAGAISAFYLAKAGFKTVLIEQHKIPRYKPCGGSISLRIINELPFNVKKVLQSKIKRIEFYSPDKNKAECDFSTPIGYTADRESFDSYLVEKSRKKGAIILENCRLEDLEIKKEFVLLKTTKGTFKSMFVVGADGTNSIVAKKSGIRPEWKSNQLASLVVTHLKSKDHDAETAKFFFGPNKSFKVGYGWVFPLDNELNVGFGAKLSEATDLGIKFQQFLKTENLDKMKATRYHATIMPYENAYLKKPYSKRVVLVGDAAGFINIISGEGIYHAILSGKLAAEQIIQAIESETTDPEKFFNQYTLKCMELFGSELNEYALKMQKQIYQNHFSQEMLVKMMAHDKKLAKHVAELLYAVGDFKDNAERINRRKYVSFLKTLLPK